MITQKQLQLLDTWQNNIFQEFSSKEIMKINNKQTKPWVFNSLKVFKKNNLITSRKISNLNLYKFNYKNPFALHSLEYLQNNFKRLDIIEEIISKVPIKEYCLLVFGSYVNNKQKENSDIDICFLVPDELTGKKIIPYISKIKYNYTTKIDDNYITFDDFYEMLENNEANLGKEIYLKHKLFFNADIYYKIIISAYENGFKPDIYPKSRK